MATNQTFTPGERYPLTADMARTVMRQGWPIVRGEPDLTRGRLFVKAPGDWRIWVTTGHAINFCIGFGGIIVSQSREPDPDLPPPLGGPTP